MSPTAIPAGFKLLPPQVTEAVGLCDLQLSAAARDRDG